MEINSKDALYAAITKYESLVATVRDDKSPAERRLYNREVSRLGVAIREYRFRHDLRLAVFRHEQLIGVFDGNSDVAAVRHYEQGRRDRAGRSVEFTIYRTFSYNHDAEYQVGLLRELNASHFSKGVHFDDVPLFSSTIEHYKVEDQFDFFDYHFNLA